MRPPDSDLFDEVPSKPGLEAVAQRALDEFDKILGKSFQSPVGHTWKVRPEHFVKLVCSGDAGPRKGVQNAGDDEGKIYYDLKAGQLKLAGIPGFNEPRISLIPLAPILVQDPDFILRETKGKRGKLMLLREFQRHGKVLLVGMIVNPLEKTMRPISLHNRQHFILPDGFDVEWSHPSLTWPTPYAARPL